MLWRKQPKTFVKNLNAYQSAVRGFEDSTSLEAQIDERDSVDTKGISAMLFRARCPLSIEVLRHRFVADSSHMSNHPFMAMLLDNLGPHFMDGIAHVKHLPALLRWRATVAKSVKYRVGEK